MKSTRVRKLPDRYSPTNSLNNEVNVKSSSYCNLQNENGTVATSKPGSSKSKPTQIKLQIELETLEAMIRLENELDKKEADHQKKIEDIERQQKIEEMDRQLKIEEMECQKKIEEMEHQKKIEVIERQQKIEEMDCQQKIEEMECQKTVEEMEHQKKIEEVERQKQFEEMERRKIIEEMEQQKKEMERQRKIEVKELERRKRLLKMRADLDSAPALEESLRTWQKQRQQQLQPRRNTIKELSFAEDESLMLLAFVEALSSLIKFIKSLIARYPSVKPDIEDLVVKCSDNLEKVYQDGKLVQGVELRPLVTELVSSAHELHDETCVLLRDKGQDLREDLANQLNLMLTGMEAEFQHCRVSTSQDTGHTYVCFQQQTAEEQDKKGGYQRGGKGLFWKLRREKSRGSASREVAGWGVAEVCSWLEALQLSEYADTFQANDIRGRELLTLTRRDLKDLGVIKVGHVKRILQAIKELNM